MPFFKVFLYVRFLENPRDGGAWWAAVYGVAQSGTWLKWLSSSTSSKLVPEDVKELQVTWRQQLQDTITTPTAERTREKVGLLSLRNRWCQQSRNADLWGRDTTRPLLRSLSPVSGSDPRGGSPGWQEGLELRDNRLITGMKGRSKGHSQPVDRWFFPFVCLGQDLGRLQGKSS